MTRKAILVMIILLTALSCVRKKPINSKLESVEFNPTEQEGQLFYINPKSDTTLTLKSGSTIKIEAYSFITKNKAKQTDSMYIEVFEYYDAEDLVLEGITTQSDSILLKNQYSFYVKAYNRVESLTPNKNMRLKIGMNKRKFTPQLYKGDKKNNGTFAWKKEKVKIDSVYCTAADIGITDSIFLYSDGSISHKFNHDLYYILDVSKTGLYLFCEEIELNNQPNVIVKVDLPQEYDNYAASCYLKNHDIHIGFSLEDKKNEFTFKIPEGESFILTCLHKEKNKVSYYIQQFTTDTKEIHIDSFTESSKGDFKKKFKELLK